MEEARKGRLAEYGWLLTSGGYSIKQVWQILSLTLNTWINEHQDVSQLNWVCLIKSDIVHNDWREKKKERKTLNSGSTLQLTMATD